MRYAILLLLLLTIASAGPLHAQSAPDAEVVVVHTTVTEQAAEDGLILRAYFTLRDSSGATVLEDAVDLDANGTITLLSDNRNAQVQIEEPDGPIKIVLLLDASGSMSNSIAIAREAAIKALESVPPNAQLFVYQFTTLDVNESIGSPASFSARPDLWAGEVAAWSSQPNASTCLNNAAFRAVQLLAETARPEDRRAVILFTDGKDELAGGERCSQREIDNAVLSANEHDIPIYTVGLCESLSCNSINEGVLADIARRTNGTAVTGELDEVEDRFQEIMDTLNSQWMARVTLYPRRGPNPAVLTVNTRDGQTALLGNFSFESDLDYFPPPTFTPMVEYREAEDLFVLNLRAADTGAIRTASIDILDTERGTIVETVPLAIERLDEPVTIPATALLAEREYCFQIRAANATGESLERGREEVERGGDPSVLGERCVVYEPRLTFVIDAITPRWDSEKLDIQLDLRGVGQRQPVFDGTIVGSTGAKVVDITGVVPNADQVIRIDLPAPLRRAGERDEFIVQLRTEAGGTVLEDDRSFSVIAPSEPSVVLPVAFGILFVLALGATVWIWYRMQEGKPQPLPEPRVYNDLTTAHAPAGATTTGPRSTLPPRIDIAITKTPDPTQKRTKTVSDFPFVIGRGERETQLTIHGDQGISRQHLQISVTGGQFTITDISSNGTFIGDRRLTQNEPEPITTRTQVRLGKNTIIELNPER